MRCQIRENENPSFIHKRIYYLIGIVLLGIILFVALPAFAQDLTDG